MLTAPGGISDPYGGSLYNYTSCAREIAQDVDKLLKKLKHDTKILRFTNWVEVVGIFALTTRRQIDEDMKI